MRCRLFRNINLASSLLLLIIIFGTVVYGLKGINSREEVAKIISEKPFLSTVGVRSMNGLGTYYGTFISEMERFSPERKEATNLGSNDGSNFYTNPGKRGTGYGYIGLTLSPYPEYMSDPAFDQYQAHRTMREDFEARMISQSKFIPPHENKYFDPNPFFNTRDPDGTIPTYDFYRLKVTEINDKPPFIPSNFVKNINGNKDVMTPFERWPKYMSSQWEAVPKNTFRQTATDSEKPAWKPQFGNRTRQQFSTIQYNIKLLVNPTSFHVF